MPHTITTPFGTLTPAKALFALYNLYPSRPENPISPFTPAGLISMVRGDAATADANLLTRIVVLARDRAIRAALDSGGPRGLALMLWKRTREGDFCERHPTLEDHAAAIRERVRPCKIYGVDS